MTIVTSFWNILDPFLWFVTTLLLNSQISNSQSTSSKHRHLEFHWNWRLLPLLIFSRRCQSSDGCHDLLVITLELLDSPENWGFIRLVLSFTISCWEYLNTGCVWWYGYLYHDVVSIVCSLEDWPDLNREFNTAIIRVFLDDWGDLERQVNVLTNTIRHDFEKTIWRNESDRSIPVESTKSNTLMKLNIVNLNSLLLLFGILCWCACRLPKQQLIIDSKLALGHTWQLRLHDNLSDDVRLQDSSSIRKEHVDILNDINE